MVFSFYVNDHKKGRGNFRGPKNKKAVGFGVAHGLESACSILYRYGSVGKLLALSPPPPVWTVYHLNDLFLHCFPFFF